MSTYLRVKEHLDRSRANYMQRTHAERMREAVNIAVLSEAKADIEKMIEESEVWKRFASASNSFAA